MLCAYNPHEITDFSFIGSGSSERCRTCGYFGYLDQTPNKPGESGVTHWDVFQQTSVNTQSQLWHFYRSLQRTLFPQSQLVFFPIKDCGLITPSGPWTAGMRRGRPVLTSAGQSGQQSGRRWQRQRARELRQPASLPDELNLFCATTAPLGPPPSTVQGPSRPPLRTQHSAMVLLKAVCVRSTVAAWTPSQAGCSKHVWHGWWVCSHAV